MDAELDLVTGEQWIGGGGGIEILAAFAFATFGGFTAFTFTI